MLRFTFGDDSRAICCGLFGRVSYQRGEYPPGAYSVSSSAQRYCTPVGRQHVARGRMTTLVLGKARFSGSVHVCLGVISGIEQKYWTRLL